MSVSGSSWWGKQTRRIAEGGLATSTEQRLRELVAWGGTSSFLEPRALVAGEDAGVRPIGQVVGLASGVIGYGYSRPTAARDGELRDRWREDSTQVAAWSGLRQRALSRLSRQATTLGAEAVIGIRYERKLDLHPYREAHAVASFAGTAVRVERWHAQKRPPVLTLAGPKELNVMFGTGVEPAGIVAGYASVQTLPSKDTRAVLWGRSRRSSFELEDLTEAVYEARRLALRRLRSEAVSLNASGVLGVEVQLEHAGTGRSWESPWTVTVDIVASAVRRTGRAPLEPRPVIRLAASVRG